MKREYLCYGWTAILDGGEANKVSFCHVEGTDYSGRLESVGIGAPHDLTRDCQGHSAARKNILCLLI